MINLKNLFIGRNKNPIKTANPANMGASKANIDPPVPGSIYEKIIMSKTPLLLTPNPKYKAKLSIVDGP